MERDDVAAIAAQYQHRLLALEAELKDRVKSGKLTPQQFAKRVSRLKQVHADLRTLRRAVQGEPNAAGGADIGIPVASSCSPDELAVCERYLEVRQAELDAANAEAAAVFTWVSDAVSGRAFPLRGTLRLSRLRKLIAVLGQRSEAAEESARRLGEHGEKLLGKNGGDKPALKGLVTIFQELDKATTRVAKLRATVKKEEARTGAMKRWLDKADAIPQRRKLDTMPTHAVFQAAAVSLQRPELAKASKTRDLVEQFWTDVVAEGLGTPDADSMKAAEEVLR